MKTTNPPKITFVILADAHKPSNNGKVDCFGLFTDLFLWAIPALRECSIAFGIKGVRKGHHELSVWLKHGREKAQKLSKVEVDATADSFSSIFAYRIPIPINHFGIHQIGISRGSSMSPKGVMWIPLRVGELPWPEPIEGDALAAILNDPTAIKRAKAVIQCPDCTRKFTFEARLDASAKATKGSRSFPANGEFTCSKCGRTIYLRDIEGQLRSQLGLSITGEPK
jgi:hypothetical protein